MFPLRSESGQDLRPGHPIRWARRHPGGRASLEQTLLPRTSGADNRGVVVTEAGLHLRLIDSCITQLKAQGPSRTCNKSEEEGDLRPGRPIRWARHRQGGRASLEQTPSPRTSGAENRGVVVTEAGSHLRLIDSCITQLKARGFSRTCNESKEKVTWCRGCG